MKRRQFAGIVLFLAACSSSSCTPAGGPAVRHLALPVDPLQITIVQRETKPIRGSDDELSIHIGNITGGQVLVEHVEHRSR